MMRLSISLCLALALGSACNAPAKPEVGVSLTHQWSVAPGSSLFVQVSLWSSPESAADSLMAVMPTVVHQLGERCRNEPGATKPGVFTLSFTLDGGVASLPTADPSTPLASCAVTALGAVVEHSSAALAELPHTGVVIHLEHMPVEG